MNSYFHFHYYCVTLVIPSNILGHLPQLPIAIHIENQQGIGHFLEDHMDRPLIKIQHERLRVLLHPPPEPTLQAFVSHHRAEPPVHLHCGVGIGVGELASSDVVF